MLFLILSTLPAILCMDAVTKNLVTPSKQLREKCGYDSCPAVSENSLNIHIVPHTHGELGFTSHFYIHYTGNLAPDQPKSKINMKRILDSTITSLWEDTEKKFTFSDMAYFFYWWSQRDSTVHRMVYELIRQGRLNFVGGGFSMPDEATTSYHAVIDMLTYSLRKLNSTFLDCARPLVSWQSDVFGHSREFASLMAQMGYDGHFINPISFDDEVGRMVSQSLEFMWRGSDDLGSRSDIFTHKLFDGYWSPPGFCFGSFCEDPLLVTSDSTFRNVEKRADAFIDAALHRQGPYYTTKNIMVMMGQRFGYFDSEVWFANIDRLIEHVNARSAGKGFPVQAYYSTPACYLKAIMEANPELTVKQDDFLPFAYDRTSMAVGFYTSRPTLKFMARQGHVFMQIIKQLQVTARVLHAHDSFMERLMWANSVFQDHNILTGVVSDLGRRYYTHKMHLALQGSTVILNKAFNILRKSPETTKYHRCAFNISLCQNTDAQQYFIVIYNPLAWNVTVNVRLPSLNQPFIVYHPSGMKVKAGIMKIPEPVFKIYRHKTYARHELVFIAEDIPPLGFRSYFIRLRSYGFTRQQRKAKRSIVKKVNKHKTKKYLVRQVPNSASEEKDDVAFDYDYFERKTTTTPRTKILFGSVDSERDSEQPQEDSNDDVITPRARPGEYSQRKSNVNDGFVDAEIRPVKNINNAFDVRDDANEINYVDNPFSAEITVNETSSDTDDNIAVFKDTDFIETTTNRVSNDETTTNRVSNDETTTNRVSNDDTTSYRVSTDKTTTYRVQTDETTTLKYSKNEVGKNAKESKNSKEASDSSEEERKNNKERTKSKVEWEKVEAERTNSKEERKKVKQERTDSKEDRNKNKEERTNSKEERKKVTEERMNSKEERKKVKQERTDSKEDRNKKKEERTNSKEERKKDKEERTNIIEESKYSKNIKDGADDDKDKDIKYDEKVKENEIESRKEGKEESRSFNKYHDDLNKNDVATTTKAEVVTTVQPSSIEEELNRLREKEREKEVEIKDGRKFGIYAGDEEWISSHVPQGLPNKDSSVESDRQLDNLWAGYDYEAPSDDLFIKNKYITINLDKNKTLSNITLSNGLNITFRADMYFYASDDPKKFDKDDRQPGITMFRAMDPRPLLIQDDVKVHIYKNRLVEEIHYEFSHYASFAIRLYRRDPVIEVEWLTGPVPIDDDIGKDIMIRYTTNLVHNGIFFTDSNGRQTIKRIRHRRATYKPLNFDYLAGNIYPVTSRIYIEDQAKNVRFSVFNDRAQGATSLADGEIDMFLHRRILTDDTGRGILTLNETEYRQGIRVRGKHYLYVTKADSKINRIFEKKLAKEKELAPQILVTKAGPYGIDSKKIWIQQINEFSALKTKLPIGVHILTLEKWGENGEDLLLRLENYLEKTDTIKSGIKKVYLDKLFVNIRVKHAYELTLGANMWLGQNKKWQWRRKQRFFNSFNEAYGSRKREMAKEGEERSEKVKDNAILLAPQQIRTFSVAYDYV